MKNYLVCALLLVSSGFVFNTYAAPAAKTCETVADCKCHGKKVATCVENKCKCERAEKSTGKDRKKPVSTR